MVDFLHKNSFNTGFYNWSWKSIGRPLWWCWECSKIRCLPENNGKSNCYGFRFIEGIRVLYEPIFAQTISNWPFPSYQTLAWFQYSTNDYEIWHFSILIGASMCKVSRCQGGWWICGGNTTWFNSNKTCFCSLELYFKVQIYCSKLPTDWNMRASYIG